MLIEALKPNKGNGRWGFPICGKFYFFRQDDLQRFICEVDDPYHAGLMLQRGNSFRIVPEPAPTVAAEPERPVVVAEPEPPVMEPEPEALPEPEPEPPPIVPTLYTRHESRLADITRKANEIKLARGNGYGPAGVHTRSTR